MPELPRSFETGPGKGSSTAGQLEQFFLGGFQTEALDDPRLVRLLDAQNREIDKRFSAAQTQFERAGGALQFLSGQSGETLGIEAAAARRAELKAQKDASRRQFKASIFESVSSAATGPV